MAATNRTFWVLVEPDRYLETFPRVAAIAPTATALTASPLLVLTADPPLVDAVRAVPGVRAVVPAGNETDGVIRGLDMAVQLCLGVADGVQVDPADANGVQVATAGAPADDRPPPYPSLWDGVTGQVIGPVVWASVNMSLSPHDEQFLTTDADDVVNFMTGYAAQFLIPVVAAGNHHDRAADYETVSPWAEPGWVVAVGATADEALTTEASWSARGTPDDPSIGPDLLAWGADLMSDKSQGTSFAAARVTRMLALIRAFLLQIAADLDRRAGRPFGVPLVGFVVLDRGFDPAAFPRLDWPALPVLVLGDTAWDGIDDHLRGQLAGTLTGSTVPVLARSVLMEAAGRCTPPGARLSAPALSIEFLVRYLSAMTAADLIALAGDRSVPPAVSGAPLFRPDDVDRLRVLVDNSAPIWLWDIDRRQGSPRSLIPTGDP